jgi:N-acetylglucosamine-6-phosphate deacetylase
MDRGVANLMRLAGISLSEALRLATVNPARAGRLAGRTEGLASGDRADIVELRSDGTVSKTWISGRRVF